MYVSPNFKTKKALKEAVAAGRRVTILSDPFGGSKSSNEQVTVEGPHYPAPHSWYATVETENGRVVRVR